MRTGSCRLLVIGVSLVVVAACGGGGGREQVASTVAPAAVETTSGATSTAATSATSVPGSSSTVITSVPSSLAPGPLSGEPLYVACGTPDGGGPALAVFALANGDLGWSACSTAQAWRTVLGATDDAVYMVSAGRDESYSVTAFDARDGSVWWTRAVTRGPWGWPEGPVAAGGIVVLEVADGSGTVVIGVDARTGVERWRLGEAERMFTAPSSPSASIGPGAGPPPTVMTPFANTPTTTVLASISGARGIDRATGATRWSLGVWVQDAAGTRVARSPAAVVGEVVVLPVTGQGVDQLVAVDATDGHELWRAPMLDHPSAADGVAVGYLSREPPSNSKVIALSMRDGSRLWSQPGMPSYGDLWAVGDGVVAVPDPADEGIVAYDLTSGELRWKRPGGQELPGEPQLVAGELVVLLWEGNVGALSTTTGATVWTQTSPLDTAMMSSAAASTSELYVSVNSLPWTD